MRGFGHPIGLEHRRAECRFERMHHGGGRAALHDRMKRSRSVPAGLCDGFVTRASSNWCKVGTAIPVTPCSFATRQKESGLNLPGTTTVPPVESVASVDATSPCT